MGVPKFYRWISERYPCLSEVVREYQIPEFDNLYLDMNGIIHVCSHPNDDDPHFRITEEKIFQDIFHYIEILFRLIRPQKVFFMAVDGVAPRAKMNQQRGRRFRSAREAEESEKKAVERGETLPTEERFDSNCITPGTEFMVKLHEQLKYFVTMKVSTDSLWKGIRVYLSGHETPGEGEHKIMDFIRSEKSKPDYDCNTRHCLYGLDADLIMLGLCTHEPHFSLLREEVRFGGKKAQKRTPTPEETTFHLLHLSLMRDYLELEFAQVRENLPFSYDLEKIIDDWVLMGFLVGNDFIPHLPQMHIAHDALPLLYKAYTEILPTLDGYINEGGSLNLVRFEKYLKRVAQYDYDHFKDNNADLKWFEGKKLSPNKKYTPKFRRKTDNMFDALANIDDDSFQEEAKHDLLEKVGKLVEFDSPDEEEDDDDEEDELDKLEGDDLLEMEFIQHKRDYYMNKLEYLSVTPQVLSDQAECYVRAIQWNLHYYYNGVCSWSWYYPHHYAPYISDVKDFTHLKLDFELGKPFLPFQQLLAVLPAASKKLLPTPYQELMSNETSPVIDFYPVDFKTDLNGKQQDWEAVVLIPFINEKRLLEAMEPLEEQMSTEEKNRNKHGPCLLYTYAERPLGQYVSPLPSMFPNIATSHAKCQNIAMDEFRVDREKLVKGLCSNVRLDVHFAGFPTLKHLQYKATLSKASVKVFQMNSRNDNMILRVVNNAEGETDLSEVAKLYLGKTIFVNWPHLIEVKIISVTDSERRIQLLDSGSKNNAKTTGGFQEEKLNDRDVPLWHLQCKGIQEHYHGRLGVDIGETKILLSALPLMGRKYVCSSSGRVTLEKQWASHPVNYVYQTIVPDISAHDTTFIQFKTVEELFQPKTPCFMLDHPHYGCMGEIVEVQTKRGGLVIATLHVPDEPNLEPIVKKQHILSVNYMPGYNLAQRLGISSHLLSRLTGTFFVTPGVKGVPTTAQKINVGLNLKFNKKNKEVPGYTKKVGENWQYSEEALKIMSQYLEKFPEMFEAIARYTNDSNVYAEDIFPDSNTAPEKLQEVQEWLKDLPCNKVQHQQCGSDVLEEPVVKAIEEAVDTVKKRHRDSVQEVTLQLKPRQLYLPSANLGSPTPDPAAKYQLFDRVINIRPGFSVPLGFRGTVTGIHAAEKESDSLLDVVFDDEFVGGLTLRSSANRGYRVPLFSVLNLSHGRRQEQQLNRSGQRRATANSRNTSSPPMVSAMSNRKRGGQNSVTAQSNRTINTGNNNQQLNQLNHSPNSPFVPRQGSSTAGDEFVSMWRQLQAASTLAGHEQCQNNNSSSLQNAAKVLPQVASREATADNLNIHRTKRRSSKSEVASSLQKTQTPSNISNKNLDDATQLMQLLNIGERKSPDKPKRKDEAATTTTSTNNPVATTKSNPCAKSNLTAGPRTNSAQTAPLPSSGNQNTSLPVASSSRNAIWELLNLVQTLFSGGAPLYQYMASGPNQLTCAQVKLPNGWTYYGYACRTREEAGETAARNALTDLKQKLPYVCMPPVAHAAPWGVPGPGSFPRPLAAPVATMSPLKMPSVPRHPPPPTWVAPDQWWTANVPDHYFCQLDNQTQLKQPAVPPSKTGGHGSNSHLTDNRFIPMQVTMNNRAKQQSNSQCEGGKGTASKTTSAESSSHPTPVSSSLQVPVTPPAPHDSNSSSKQTTASGPSKQQHVKSRQRSRLAIRFNNPTPPE